MAKPNQDEDGLGYRIAGLSPAIRTEIEAYLQDKKIPLSEEAQTALWELLIPTLLSHMADEFRDYLADKDVDE